MDPLVYLIICCGFAGLFLASALKKILSFRAFQSILGSYQILPKNLTTISSALIVAAEFTLSALWIVASMRPFAAVASSVLLIIYTFAIGVNLKRSRSYISCGCGWNEQPLSWSLVVRNCIYILLILSTLAPVFGRELYWIDFALGVLTLTVTVLLNRCADTLIANNSNIASWKR